MIVQILRFIFDTRTSALYVFLCVTFSTYYLMVKCRRDPRLMKFAKTLPGPNGLPLVGNSLQYAFGGLDHLAYVLTNYSQKYGSVYKIWFGKQLVIGLSDIDHVEGVLRSSKSLDKPHVLLEGFTKIWGNALFPSPKSLWKVTRKNLQPVFAKNNIKIHIPTLQKSIEKYEKYIRSELNGPEFNMYKYLPYMMTDAFLSSYCDIKISVDENKSYKLHAILKEGTKIGLKVIIYPWRRVNIIKDLFDKKKHENIKRKLQEFYTKHITKKIFSVDYENFKEQRKDGDKIAKSFLLLAHLQEEEMKLKNYAFDEIMETIAASSDTTATVSAYSLLMLAMYPKIQDKVYEEIHQVFGDRDISVTLEDLEELKYLDQVLKETSRRFTIVPNIFRYIEEDIKIGSMTIPGGASVMLRFGDIHMNPQIYPNPSHFNPENFSSEAISQRSKYTYLAFSLGIRDCVGKTFAEVMMKLILVNLLRKYKFSTTTKMEDIDYEIGFITSKRGGYWMSIIPRK